MNQRNKQRKLIYKESSKDEKETNKERNKE